MKEFYPPFSTRTDDELILIAHNNSDWDEEAVTQAKEELRRRNISQQNQLDRFHQLTSDDETDRRILSERNEPLKVLWQFAYQHELLMIKSVLESEGIPCMTRDEFTLQIDPLLSQAIGGIRLMVFESDFERAMGIIKQFGYGVNEESPGTFLTKLVAWFNRNR